MPKRTNETLGNASDLAALIGANYKINEPQQSSAFRDFLMERIKNRKQYYLFADVRYLLQPELDSKTDWLGRIHKTRKITPATGAGVADRAWSLAEIASLSN